MKRIPVAICIICLLMPDAAFAASAGSIARKADRLLSKDKYDEALAGYDQALAIKPDDPVIQYNRAVTLYRKGDFVGAEDAFLRSLVSGKEDLEEQTIYNSGNSKYRGAEGLEKGSPQSALKNYGEAVQYYKRAMEIDSDDMDAKHNYEYTLKKIDDLKKKMQQQPQQQKQQQQQDKQDQDKQDKQDQGKDKKEQQKQQQQQQKQDKKDRDQEKDKKKEEQQKQQQQDKQKEEQEKKEKQQDQQQQQQKEKEKQEEERRKQQEQKEKEEQERKEREQQRQQQEKEERERQQQERERQQGDQGQEDQQSEPSFGEDLEPVEGQLTKEEAEMLLRGQAEEEARMRAEQRKGGRARRPPVVKDW